MIEVSLREVLEGKLDGNKKMLETEQLIKERINMNVPKGTTAHEIAERIRQYVADFSEVNVVAGDGIRSVSLFLVPKENYPGSYTAITISINDNALSVSIE